jgi:hypothetical protein
MLAITMDAPFDLDALVSKWQRGALAAEALPDVAYRLLEAGFETPTLLELAGLERPSFDEAGPLFARVLEELGRSSLTIADDPLHFAIELARRILARDVGLIAGCREMLGLRGHDQIFDLPELLPFVGVESETDTLPLGDARAHWSADALVEVDARITSAEASYRDFIDDACRALIRIRDPA